MQVLAKQAKNDYQSKCGEEDGSIANEEDCSGFEDIIYTLVPALVSNLASTLLAAVRPACCVSSRAVG